MYSTASTTCCTSKTGSTAMRPSACGTPEPSPAPEPQIITIDFETGWTDPAAVEAIGVVHLSGDTDPALILLP